MNNDLIERIKALVYKWDNMEPINDDFDCIREAITALSPVLPEDVKRALDYLKNQAEDCDSMDDYGAHAEELWHGKNLIERLAREKGALEYAVQSYAKSIGELQQRIKELEVAISMANQHMLSDKAKIAEYEKALKYIANRVGGNRFRHYARTELERIRGMG